MAEALEAIDLLEAQNYFIVGWEGWVKSADGRIGHGSAPQGAESPKGFSVEAAAQFCRKTIPIEAARWFSENPRTADVLHFCITVLE